MFRHIKVTSATQMNTEIFNFLADLLGVTVGTNDNYIRLKSKNGKNFLVFSKISSYSDSIIADGRTLISKSNCASMPDAITVWITDVSEDTDMSVPPYALKSTIGIASTYVRDMQRKELDTSTTSTLRGKLNHANQLGKKILDDRAKTAAELIEAYLIDYNNKKKIEEDVTRGKMVWHRINAKTAGSVYGTLVYSSVPGTEKWLDCLYNDGTFMFALYNLSIPSETKSLIIGDMETYQESVSGKTFFLSNSWGVVLHPTNAGFVLPDIYGRNPNRHEFYEGEEDAYCDRIDEASADYWEKKRIEGVKADELEVARKNFTDKELEATEARRVANLARDFANQAREEAEAELNPEIREEKLARAKELEERAKVKEDIASDLEDEANALHVIYVEAQDAYNVASNNTNLAYGVLKDAYVNFSRRVLAVGSKEDNISDYIASGGRRTVGVQTYNNDLFCAYRLDVDADASGFPRFKVYKNMVSPSYYRSGEQYDNPDDYEMTYFHLHIAPKDLHLKRYSLNYDDYPAESITDVPVLIGWEHQLLHHSYEYEESNIGVSMYSWLNKTKKSYDFFDNKSISVKKFNCFIRSGTGGNSVNTINNMSTPYPLIFYIQRDPEELDLWASVGQSPIVNYINMYNMGTGTTVVSSRGEYATCYDLWKRRPEATTWNPILNDDNNAITEVWGFGGYPGIMFKHLQTDNLDEIRGRDIVVGKFRMM